MNYWHEQESQLVKNKCYLQLNFKGLEENRYSSPKALAKAQFHPFVAPINASFHRSAIRFSYFMTVNLVSAHFSLLLEDFLVPPT